MADYNGTINNFIQGVSQQPAIQRIEGQLEAQNNCLSSVINGLIRRPSTAFLNYLNANFTDNSTFYTYDRGDNKEKYIIIISSGTVYVYDLETGAQRTVTNPTGASSYLSNTGDPNVIQLYTVGDTTFLLNSTQITTAYNNSTERNTYKYIIHCKRASYGGLYTVSAGTTQVGSVQLPDTVTLGSTEVSKSLTLDSGLDVCFDLYLDLYNYYLSNPSVAVYYYGGIIHVYSSSDLQLTVTDSNGNAELFCMEQEVSSYDDLPNVCPKGYKAKVTGDDESDWNDYYVEFINTQDVGNIGRGYWKECVGWDEPTKLNPNTMPHKIVRNSDGTFTISSITWVEKEAGDETSNPLPSFIDNKITAMTFYQDRLVLSTASTVCASMTSDYFNFFSDTVTSTSAADPIDTTTSDNKVTDIKHMLTFNGSLVIFSQQGQYFHSADIPFDSEHFALVPKSHFSSVITAIPQTSATQVYIPFNSGDYTGIRVLDTNTLTGNIQGQKITDYVDQYIHGSCKQILVSADHNFLFVLTEAEPQKIYVYQWYTKDRELKQQAWHVWEFNNVKEIKSISIINNTLYLICFPEFLNYGSQNSIILTMDLYNAVIYKLPYKIHLDMYSLVYGASVGDTWRFAPHPIYTEQTSDKPSVILSDSFEGVGRILIEGVDYNWSNTWVLINKNKVILKSGQTPYIYVGYLFESGVTLTNPYITSYLKQPIIKGTLRYKQFIFTLEDTGFLSVVFNKYGTEQCYNFTSNIVNTSVVGTYGIADYLFKIPVRTRADGLVITLKSNTYLPFQIINMDWSGTYREKGRRI